MIRVKLYGSVSKGIGKELVLEGGAGKEVHELLSELSVKNRDLSPDNPDLIIFINGVEAHLLGGLKYRLKDGDELSVMPAAHGGSEAPQVKACIGQPAGEVLFKVLVKPECITSEGLLTLLATQVYYAYLRNEMKGRKPEIEFLLRLAGTDQINDAIKRCGGDVEVYVCRGAPATEIKKEDIERAELGAFATLG